MKIELHKIPIKEVVKDYKDNSEEGVTAYGGKLDIRPKYQREFVYKDKQRDEVIKTVRKDFPLNIIYWVKKADGNFEVLGGEGSARTLPWSNVVRPGVNCVSIPEQTIILKY